jgi:hypothetical protein
LKGVYCFREFILSSALAGACFGQPLFTAQQVASPPPLNSTDLVANTGIAISADGVVIGHNEDLTAGFPGALINRCYISKGNTFKFVSVPDGIDCTPQGGNSKGEFVGFLVNRTNSLDQTGFIFSNGQMSKIPAPPGTNNVISANAINENSEVTGVAVIRQSFFAGVGFIFSNGVSTAIAGLSSSSDPHDAPLAINDAGDVAGTAIPAGATVGFQAYLTLRNQPAINLDLTKADPTQSTANAINNAGSVVVNQDTARVFDGIAFHQIPNPDDPARATVGFSINNRGAVVGFYNNATGSQALYYADGVSYNLNTLVTSLPPGIRLVSGTYINDKGQILARAFTLPTGESPVFLLTPIPVGNRP